MALRSLAVRAAIWQTFRKAGAAQRCAAECSTRAPALGSQGLMTSVPVSLGPAPLTSSLQPGRALLRSIAAAAAFGQLLTEILAAPYLAPVR